MAKQQQFPVMKASGGVLRKVIGIVVCVGVLWFIIKSPAEAATVATHLGSLFGSAVNGLAAFLKSLFG